MVASTIFISSMARYRPGQMRGPAPNGMERAVSATLQDAAWALADELLARAPLALQASKQVMLESLRAADLFTTLHEDYPLAQRMLASQDAKKRPAAFAEKRAPRWRGR